MSAIHSCPAFLPWHRKFILDLETDLQQVSGDPNLGLPYWNWPSGASTASMWDANLLGGDGDSNEIVQTGPFSQGQWLIVNMSGVGTGPLRRNFGNESWARTLPTQSEIIGAMLETPYDRAPWNRDSSPSFRNQLEGWIGPNLHNRGHGWVGGSMLPMTSPNDPVFFMHHCMVDKLWHEWQLRFPNQGYQPTGSGSFGQNLTDPMNSTPGLANRPLDVLDSSALGISYDSLLPGTPGGGASTGSGTALVVNAAPVSASIGAAGEVDLYSFVVSQTGDFVVETTGASDTFMDLFGPNNASLQVTRDDDSGADLNARITSRLSPGMYTVRLHLFDATRTGAYAIQVRVVTASPALPALTINGPAVNGVILAANESDTYVFAVGSSGRFTVETLGGTDTFLNVFGPNSETQALGSDDDSGADLNGRVVANLTPGQYFARVRHFSPTGSGPYAIRVTST
ncbi:MAG: tyrosinase [Verrucomicrobiales bacterium]|jgi:tyrosinase